MSVNECSKSAENSSLESQEDLQKPQSKQRKPVNRLKINENDILSNQLSSREERKIQQALQRMEESERLGEAATLKRKRSKLSPKHKTNPVIVKSPEKAAQGSPDRKIDVEQGSLAPMKVEATIINPQLLVQVPVQIAPEQNTQTKLRINPKLKMKEKHHIFLYLSECYDKCQDSIQRLNASATQLYSPPRQLKSDNTSLFPINQEVYQETQVVTKNLKFQFQSCDQKEFISKYLDRKYLENVLRESRLSYKRGSDNKTNGKPQTQKKY